MAYFEPRNNHPSQQVWYVYPPAMPKHFSSEAGPSPGHPFHDLIRKKKLAPGSVLILDSVT
jgi:hypothetical protein